MRVPSGDDAAVVEPRAASAVTVDAIVDGVHFLLEDFGRARRSGARRWRPALSDLAAMGAAQGEAYVVVAARAICPTRSCSASPTGLAEMAVREEVTIAGGDLVGSPVLVVSVTAIGYEPGAPASSPGRGPSHATWSR